MKQSMQPWASASRNSPASTLPVESSTTARSVSHGPRSSNPSWVLPPTCNTIPSRDMRSPRRRCRRGWRPLGCRARRHAGSDAMRRRTRAGLPAQPAVPGSADDSPARAFFTGELRADIFIWRIPRFGIRLTSPPESGSSHDNVVNPRREGPWVNLTRTERPIAATSSRRVCPSGVGFRLTYALARVPGSLPRRRRHVCEHAPTRRMEDYFRNPKP